MMGDLAAEFARAVVSDEGLASSALVIARLDCPQLDPAPYLRRLDEMGAAARARLHTAQRSRPLSRQEAVAVLNAYLFDDLRLWSDPDGDDDPRNSFLNEVLDRRVGIPIMLGVVYIEVARRAGIRIEGINFPGHFLLLCPADQGEEWSSAGLVLDPFEAGAPLSERECREILHERLGGQVDFHPALLAPATKQQILARLLVHLKRVYVGMRSFPQARDVTRLLLAINPSTSTELRDRGLLAYHLRDFPAALRDLEAYLRLARREEPDGDGREEREQIWEHVKTLRRRVASLN
jgi:regulator of sirC expression with transglutaminase-like and TPR domain